MDGYNNPLIRLMIEPIIDAEAPEKEREFRSFSSSYTTRSPDDLTIFNLDLAIEALFNHIHKKQK